MVMDSASNIERGSKMIISLRGKQRQALLGGWLVEVELKKSIDEVGSFGEDVCPALGRGKRTRCVWWKNGWEGSLIEKAEKP